VSAKPSRPSTWPDLVALARFRARDGFQAYAICCLVSTTVVAAVNFWLILVAAALYGNIPDALDPSRLVTGLQMWLMLTALGFIAASPFAAPVTWAGIKLEIESLAYYGLAGGLIMTALAYGLVGLPHHSPFGEGYLVWTIGPPCGTVWGMTWWWIHRRWRKT
jgi:hypothetical protein